MLLYDYALKHYTYLIWNVLDKSLTIYLAPKTLSCGSWKEKKWSAHPLALLGGHCQSSLLLLCDYEFSRKTWITTPSLHILVPLNPKLSTQLTVQKNYCWTLSKIASPDIHLNTRQSQSCAVCWIGVMQQGCLIQVFYKGRVWAS